MPQTEAEADECSIFKLYRCKTPHVPDPNAVQHATERQLLEDLHAMWDDGWQIQFVFPSGTHILMIRRPEWVKDVESERRKAAKKEKADAEE